MTTKETSEQARHIYDALRTQKVATLATLKDDGQPHLSVVYYSIDEDFTIHFATKNETLKHKNIQGNPAVTMLVFDEEEQLTVQINGTATQVLDAGVEQTVLENMFKSAGSDLQMPPITKLRAGSYIVYEIKPQKINMAFFLRPQSGGYDMYETLEF